MKITPKIIREKLEIEFGTDLTVKSRKRNIVYQRMVAFKLCRRFTEHSLTEIADEFNKDHATVIYSLDNFDFHKDQYYFEYYKKVFSRYSEHFIKITENRKDLDFLKEIIEIEQLKDAFIEEKLKMELELTTMYEGKISELENKIDKYEKYSFFGKIVALPEDNFLEIKDSINAYFIMNGMNSERKKNRINKQN